MHSLQVSQSNRTLSLSVSGQQLTSVPFPTLKQHSRFSKNHLTCTHERGIRQGNNCITFKQLTHVCFLLDHDDEHNIAINQLCGLSYDKKIYDSSEPVQEIAFWGYDLDVEIRSSRDPHIRFG